MSQSTSPPLSILTKQQQQPPSHKHVPAIALEHRTEHPPHVPICPSLPPELWLHILTYHTDLTHLWITCRQVSSTFRACVEDVFAKYHIKDVYIDWQAEKYNLGGRSKRPEIPTSFSRFSSDREKRTVFFNYKTDKHEIELRVGKGGKKEKLSVILLRWEDNIQSLRPELPNYTIRIGNLVNDTVLPNLVFNREDRQVAFEWRGMLQAFFREEQSLRLLKKRCQEDVTKQLEHNRLRLSKGEKLTPSDMPLSWSSTIELQSRKQIRRARLKEHYVGDEERIWAIDSLKPYEESRGADGTLLPLSEIPGAGLGEKWFGSTYMLQEMYLDEWSCLHRIDIKVEHMRSGKT